MYTSQPQLVGEARVRHLMTKYTCSGDLVFLQEAVVRLHNLDKTIDRACTT
jgi:hypothetical protein